MIEKKRWPNGEKIREFREAKGWSQLDMVLRILDLVDSLKTEEEKEAAKCSKKTIEDAENSRHQITERKLKAIAAVLGAKFEDIILPKPPKLASKNWIEVIIDEEFENFGPERQERFLAAIISLLGTTEIIVIRVRPGSVRITLEVPSAKAEMLQQALRAGRLTAFRVVDALLVDKSPIQGKPIDEREKASQLVSKARKIYLGIYERRNLELAGDLARKATKIDPTLSSAWAARARITASFILRGWTADRVGKRRAVKAQKFATDALALSATEEDAYFALGVVKAVAGYHSEAEIMYRRVLELSPRDAAAKRALAFALLPQGRVPEVFALLQEAVAAEPRNPLPHFDLAVVFTAIRNYPEACKEAETAIGLDPIASAVLLRAWLAAAWEGKPSEMPTILAGLKPEDRDTDEAVHFEMWSGLLRRKPKDVLTAVRRNTKAYIKQSYVFSGPIAWHTALAHHIAKENSLALHDWRDAENEIRKHVKRQPGNLHFRVQLATTLAWLGEERKAAKEFGHPLEAWDGTELTANRARDLAGYYAALGNAKSAVPLIRRALEPDSGPGGLTIELVRLDPWWDKLRGAKEFKELLRAQKE